MRPPPEISRDSLQGLAPCAEVGIVNPPSTPLAPNLKESAMREPKSIVLARAALARGEAVLASPAVATLTDSARSALECAVSRTRHGIENYLCRDTIASSWHRMFPQKSLANLRDASRIVRTMCNLAESNLREQHDCATCEWCESTHPIDNLTVLGDSEHSIYCCDACRTKNAAFCG